MNLNHIAYFLAVVEHGMMHKAAAEIGMSQPALTKAVKRLEEELGCELFHRTSQGMTPTALGLEFYRRAKVLDAKYRDALSDMGELRAGAAAMVKVGSTTGGESLVAKAYLSLSRRRPALRVESKVLFAEGLVRLVENGEVDFAVAPVPAFLSDRLSAIQIMEERTWIVARAGHPLHALGPGILPQHLEGCSWILPSLAIPAREQLDSFFRKHGVPGPKVVIQSDYGAPNIVYEIVANSDLIGLCNTRSRHAADAAGLKALEVPLSIFPRQLGIISRNDREPSPLSFLFQQEIREVAAAASTAQPRSTLDR